MVKKDINTFSKEMYERFVLAQEMLGKIKSENGQTYKNMKITLSELKRMSSDKDITFEALRKKMQILEEQTAQYMREQRFVVGHSIEGAEDYRKNDKLLGSVFAENRKKNAMKAANILLQAANSWVKELDHHYPDIKKREIEQQEALLAEEKNSQEKRLSKYVNVIHKYDKEFAETFVHDKKSTDPLYQAASAAVQKLMNRMHREHPKAEEHLYVKDDLKAARKALEEYIWSVREKYGTGKKAGYNNAVYEKDVLETAEKITDPEEKKNFTAAVNMMESTRMCNISIDRAYGVTAVARSQEDFSVAVEENLTVLKEKNKALWGDAKSNSSEFNNFIESYENAMKVLGQPNVPRSEYREALKKLEEASLIYVRAKRVQKGYDTKNIPDPEIDNLMIGKSKKGNGPSIFSQQGRKKYDFAREMYLSAVTARYTLDYLEEKLENDAKDAKRAETYAKNRDNFMAHKEKLDKEFKAFENGEKGPKGNVEEFSKQVEKVKELSNAMAEKYEKGMDVWSNELEEYKEAIKTLKGIEKNQKMEVLENQEIEDISFENQDGFSR